VIVTFSEPARLNDRGQCCGRKPLDYKTGNFAPGGPHKFCDRCSRAFDRDTGEQIPNWAYQATEGGFLRRNPGA
jgi:hypothetical protein